MRRKWNWRLWVGFLVVVAGFVSYTFFVQFPITRDFPWADFVLLAIGAVLLVSGLKRAFGEPGIYRGKVFGSIFAVLSVLIIGFFSWVALYELKQLPASAGAPRVGQKAPDFTLPDSDNKAVALSDLLSTAGANGKPGAVLLIFYRGFW